jgi:hypothetical protein
MTQRNVGPCRALIGALAVVLAQAASSAQDDDLQLVEAGSALAGRLSAVGRVYSGYGPALSMASGFLVSSCHVLTAGHVLAKVGESVRLGAEVRFFPGGPPANTRTSAGSAMPVSGRVVAASQDFVMQVAPSGFDQQRIPNDWALIELDHAVNGIEPVRLLYPAALTPSDAAYTVGGYPLGQARQGLFAQEHCLNWSGNHGGASLKGILIADCAVRAGMSGGPLLLDGESQVIAAGILVERFTIGQKIMSIGVPVAAFAEKIEAAMRESDICAVGAPFVWPDSRPGLAIPNIR